MIVSLSSANTVVSGTKSELNASANRSRILTAYDHIVGEVKKLPRTRGAVFIYQIVKTKLETNHCFDHEAVEIAFMEATGFYIILIILIDVFCFQNDISRDEPSCCE